jgi:cell wall-associated NlpC family hydrolase
VWKKEQFLHRSILTGFAVCILSAGLPALASAQTTGEPSAPAAATAPVTSAAESTAPAETAAPTDGADLVMWNASPTKADDAAAATTAAPSRVTRVLHLQKFAGGIAARGAAMASNLTRNAMRFLGVPYSFGGTSGYGFDCSGFTQHVFAMMGVHLPRMADEQYYAGKRISGQPQPGDLVFFHTYASGVSHVGISLGNDRFVHASSSHGVMISSLHDSYWGPRFLGAKRVAN